MAFFGVVDRQVTNRLLVLECTEQSITTNLYNLRASGHNTISRSMFSTQQFLRFHNLYVLHHSLQRLNTMILIVSYQFHSESGALVVISMVSDTLIPLPTSIGHHSLLAKT